MSMDAIGKWIAALRKERGVRQEELANYVGVSAQAVSKWENGGVPDTELLPKIADFFSVSIDMLFGRDVFNYSDLGDVLRKKILNSEDDQRFKRVFDYCWDMECALFGDVPKNGSIEDYENKLGSDDQRYSSIMTDYGFTRMGIANRLQYFLLVPEIHNTEKAFFDGVDYRGFFEDFSDEYVFNACVLLHKRESDKAFTEKLLMKNLNIEFEKARNTLFMLEKYGLIGKTQIEMDDEIQTVYHFRPTPSFVAFLIFAREIIMTPHSFDYYSADRSKPYL